MSVKKKVELLAPAGSYENFKAAISAGADAVYLGGNLFSARAYANNFDENNLIKAIDYAHLHNSAVYMTVNTLLKEKELESLVGYMVPYYESGLDGVIVQDLGVVSVLRECFPDMPVHASTQMSVSGVEGAKHLQSLGLTRVVPARELSLPEIKAIYDATGMEIESFIHGALCYCYSGQCLLSSLIGGRSGNRGRCAQPCRLAYNNSIDGKEKYILSPKDMATVKILPELIENGVYSMKIEGRMKSAEYTAGVVSIYRKYIDMYLEKGKQGYNVTEKDMLALMDLYNRGGFNKGYYQVHNGPEMMSTNRPNHAGVEAIKAVKATGGKVTFKALTDIYKGDVFEITKDFNLTSGVDVAKGKELVIQVPAKFISKPGATYSRIKCGSLVKEINDRYISDKELLKEPVCMKVYITKGIDLNLEMWLKNEPKSWCHVLSFEVVSPAQNRPTEALDVIKQLKKLGETPFIVENDDDIRVECGEGSFIPVQALNHIRREAVDSLLETIKISRARYFEMEVQYKPVAASDSTNSGKMRILVSTQNQISKLLELISENALTELDRVYVDYSCFYDAKSLDLIRALTDKTAIYMTLPRILRENKKKEFNQLIDIAQKTNIKGFLARTLEECALLKGKNVIADSGLYVWNNKARGQVLALAGEFTAPLELTESELSLVDSNNMEVIKYGYFPVMLSAQCVKKTCGKCDGKMSAVSISDRKNAKYLIQSNCNFCHTVMYNDKPLYIEEELTANVRYEFTFESGEEMANIFKNGPKDYTTGHYHKGVM